MNENRLEDIKGRVEEAVGTAIDDKDLQRKGRIDQTAAAAKRQIDKASDKIKDVIQPKS